MPFYKNGQIWVHSVTNRPALDVISASFFFIGMIFLVHRIKYHKKWEFVALLISIPVLMMPSILSLAYPGENPSLNRSAGAYVPIFIIIGIGFTFIKDSILEMFPKKISKIVAMVFCVLVGIISIKNNYKLVFSNYKEQFDRNAWNSSEIGEVITNFVQSGGEKDNAYVIPYPHWVDTRLVGFNARHPGKDYALNRSAISVLSIDEDKKLFIYKPEDFDTNEVLEQYFPDGQISIYYSEVPGKDFIIYTVE